MAEQHTPSVDYFREFYAVESETESLDEARAEWDRMIAQVRAEAREKAAQIADEVAKRPGSPFRSARVLAQRMFAAHKIAAQIREQGS